MCAHVHVQSMYLSLSFSGKCPRPRTHTFNTLFPSHCAPLTSRPHSSPHSHTLFTPSPHSLFNLTLHPILTTRNPPARCPTGRRRRTSTTCSCRPRCCSRSSRRCASSCASGDALHGRWRLVCRVGALRLHEPTRLRRTRSESVRSLCCFCVLFFRLG